MHSPQLPPRATARQRAGHAAEQRALDYLTARGLRLLERNYRVRLGELDLVMADGSDVVFVEVRQRAGDAYGGAAASVTPAKQARVRRAAQSFLAERCGRGRWPAMRFDVVAIEGERLRWIRGAF
jgi:putative endonuclease